MKKIFVILSTGIFLFVFPIEILSKNKKDSINTVKIVSYELAKEVFKNRSFGIQVDYMRGGSGSIIDLYHDQNSFMGFENDKLILQGAFCGDRQIFDICNYEYKEDRKGNVTVSFEYNGRLLFGKMRIEMKSGDNYAEIFQTRKAQYIVFTGNILPSNACNYRFIVKEY